ncbi:MAG: N-acetylmuramoyl-L-alanine amidase [Succinivibrio sp.]|nr:N-acetylmuramoyl-L-alanine amidase [Succinivibrio sp.]MCI7252747.1 N-acetylmuramoyl-L-alanine amidase [Succinatimonas sp.]MDD6376309.1 N-acetylmuramoyl-L-alanine amidase [Succinatimonas sp.]
MASASAIKSVRSFHNAQKTRVVLDLDSKPNYATSLSQNRAVFSIRVRNLSKAALSPSNVPLSSQSCVRGVQRRIEKNDVRYLFSLNRCAVPKIFVLAPKGGNNDYRLVIDFESSSEATFSANATVKNTVTKTASNGTVIKDTVVSTSKTVNGKLDTTVPLSTYERDLFIKYTTVSKDGFRSMSTANAAKYQQELAKLRSDYKKAQAQKTSEQGRVKTTITKNTKTNTKTKIQSHDVEELVSDASAPPVPVQATPVSRPFIIAIDAGHGGKDPGAIGKRGVREKNVTLAISKALYSYINSNKQFRGTLTRSRDVFVDLDRRSEIARLRKADLLISIHADSVASGSSTARGASVLVLSENRAVRENGKILRNNKQKKLIGGAGEVMDQSVGNPYLATAILDMSSTNSRSEGNLLAQEILHQLSAFTHVRKSQPIKASLAVLKAPDIPSLLIETGYLSNRYEEIQLNQPNYQKQIAYRIYLGIKSYYEKYPAQKLRSRQESYARTKNMTKNGGTAKSVTVKKGESLGLIAKRYGTTIAQLKKLNSLKSDTVHVGQVLYLP